MTMRDLHLTLLTSALLLMGGSTARAIPLLDEVMGLEAANAIRFDPLDANHNSVARIEYLGTTIAADGDYQYWYDLVSGNKAWTRDVSFWVSNADSITAVIFSFSQRMCRG